MSSPGGRRGSALPTDACDAAGCRLYRGRLLQSKFRREADEEARCQETLADAAGCRVYKLPANFNASVNALEEQELVGVDEGHEIIEIQLPRGRGDVVDADKPVAHVHPQPVKHLVIGI